MRFAGAKLQSYMHGGMDSQMLADYGIKTRSQEREAATNADATVAMGGLQGVQAISEANYAAEATRAEGQAAGQMAMADGLGSLASGIAGGFINKGVGPKYAFDPAGSQGNPLGGGGLLPLNAG